VRHRPARCLTGGCVTTRQRTAAPFPCRGFRLTVPGLPREVGRRGASRQDLRPDGQPCQVVSIPTHGSPRPRLPVWLSASSTKRPMTNPYSPHQMRDTACGLGATARQWSPSAERER
jgi:hypothetical protein